MINIFNDLFGANRIRPFVAWQSMQKLLRDPEATGEVFKIINALQGESAKRAVARLKSETGGQQLLNDKPDICSVLSDKEKLRAMPEGSLGRIYLNFVESEGISAQGLQEASEEAPRREPDNPDTEWFGLRLRDTHDLWHVVTGYGRDPFGELCLLSFSHVQTRNRGVGFIVAVGVRNDQRLTKDGFVRECVQEGREHSEAATWLPSVRWEEKLALPLDQVRTELNIKPPALYQDALENWPEEEQRRTIAEKHLRAA